MDIGCKIIIIKIMIDLFRNLKVCRKTLISLFSDYVRSLSTMLEHMSNPKECKKCIIISISFHSRKNSLISLSIYS